MSHTVFLVILPKTWFFQNLQALVKNYEKICYTSQKFSKLIQKVKKLKKGKKCNIGWNFANFVQKKAKKKAIFGHFGQKHDFSKPSSACKKLWKKCYTSQKFSKLIQKSKKLKQGQKCKIGWNFANFVQKLAQKRLFWPFWPKTWFFQNLQALVKNYEKFVTPAKNFQNWFKKVKKLKKGKKCKIGWNLQICPKKSQKKGYFLAILAKNMIFSKPSSACKNYEKNCYTSQKFSKLIQKSKKIKTRAKNAKLDEILQILSKNRPKKAILAILAKTWFFQNLQALVKNYEKICYTSLKFSKLIQKSEKIKKRAKNVKLDEILQILSKKKAKKSYFWPFWPKTWFFKTFKRLWKLWKKLLHQPKIFKIDSKSEKIKKRAKNVKLDEILQILSKNRPKKAIFGHFGQKHDFFKTFKRLWKIIKNLLHQPKFSKLIQKVKKLNKGKKCKIGWNFAAFFGQFLDKFAKFYPILHFLPFF